MVLMFSQKAHYVEHLQVNIALHLLESTKNMYKYKKRFLNHKFSLASLLLQPRTSYNKIIEIEHKEDDYEPRENTFKNLKEYLPTPRHREWRRIRLKVSTQKSHKSNICEMATCMAKSQSLMRQSRISTQQELSGYNPEIQY